MKSFFREKSMWSHVLGVKTKLINTKIDN